jgi:hypothetical protein
MTRSGEGLGAVPLDTLSGPAAFIRQAPGYSSAVTDYGFAFSEGSFAAHWYSVP